MPIDPAYLSLPQPQIQSPLQSIGTLMQLRNQGSEIALRNAQAQQAQAAQANLQAEADQKRRDLGDQATLQNMMADAAHPEYATQAAKGDYSFADGQVQRSSQDKWIQSTQASLKAKADTDKLTLENEAAWRAAAGKTITGIAMLAPEDRMAALTQAAPELQKLPGAQPLGDISQIDTSDAGLNRLAAGNNFLLEHTTNALALKGEQQKVATGAATEKKDIAEGAKAQAETDLANFRLHAAQQAQQGQGAIQDPEAAVAKLIDPVKFPMAYKHAVEAGKLAIQGADPTILGAQAKLFSEAVEKVHEKEVLPNLPETRQGKAIQAGMDAQATIGPDLAKAKALREGDNPAMAGVPPAMAAATQAASIKLDQEYAKASASADAVKSVLDMAAKGNKAAGANAPLVGVGAVNAVNGIKRMNSAEIAQYGTAGSLLDKIQGKLQGWTEGQPIPKDVLDDMQAFHQALRSSSYKQYTDGLKSLNLRSGAKLGPAFDNPTISVSVPATLKSQFPNDAWARDPQGQLHHAPKGQALPQGWNAVN